jgi:hypothetical protein
LGYIPRGLSYLDLDSEANVPTWFSSIQLFGVGITAMLIFLYRSMRLFWVIIAMGYIFLSLDEVAQIHELFDKQILPFKWVYLYAPFTIAFVISVVLLLFSEFKNHLRLFHLFIVGVVIAGIGGLGMELLSHYGNKYGIMTPFLRQVEFVLEEGMELFGTAIILYVFLVYLENPHKSQKSK